MGFFSFIKSFWDGTDPMDLPYSSNSLNHQSIDLVVYLKGLISLPQRAKDINEKANYFLGLPEGVKEGKLPKMYLEFEHYLTEIEEPKNFTKASLRKVVSEKFPEFTSNKILHIIFQDAKQQEKDLRTLFISYLTEELNKFLGVANKDPLIHFLSKDGLHADQLDDKIEQNRLCHIFVKEVEDRFGPKYSGQLIQKAYDKVATKYQLLDTFPSIIELIPERHLDGPKINLLSKHQLLGVLLQKVETLEALNNDFTKANKELTKANALFVETNTELGASFNRMNAVLNTISDGIITADQRGIIIMVNQRVEEIWGYSKNELEGQSLSILMPKKYVKDHEDGMDRYERTQTPRVLDKEVKVEGMRKDGTIFPISIKISRTESFNGHFFTAALKDITQELQIERELSSYRKDLESKVEDRTKALQTVQNELEKSIRNLEFSNSELEQFAYVASHDLQEPLRMVASYVQLIERKLDDKLDDSVKEYIMYSVEGVKRMQALIRDLLEYSRISRVNSSLSVVNLDETVESLQYILSQKIERKEAKITVGKLPTLQANKVQIKQLFQNLISNALKFKGEENPVIEIGSEDLGSHWKCWVKDNGIGIDPAFKDRIFVIFQRLHNRSTYKGTGIGLAICKKIVDWHEGEIWLDSEEGKGATFYFTLKKDLVKD